MTARVQDDGLPFWPLAKPLTGKAAGARGKFQFALLTLLAPVMACDNHGQAVFQDDVDRKLFLKSLPIRAAGTHGRCLHECNHSAKRPSVPSPAGIDSNPLPQASHRTSWDALKVAKHPPILAWDVGTAGPLPSPLHRGEKIFPRS